MKTLLRIIIILAVSLVVVWATNALGQNSSANQEFPPRFEQEGGENANSSDQQALPERRPGGERGERGEHGAEGFSLRGLASFGQTLIPITIIIALVTTISNFINRRKRAQKLQAST